MVGTDEGRTLCVGVDLHKTQFMVCAVLEDSDILLEEVFKTDETGYKGFSSRMHGFEDEHGCSIGLAIETIGNARFFKNRMESEGFSVVVVNTNRFRVIATSTRKNAWEHKVLSSMMNLNSSRSVSEIID